MENTSKLFSSNSKGFHSKFCVDLICKTVIFILLQFSIYTRAQSPVLESQAQWKAEWIAASGQKNEPNNWTSYGKSFRLKKVPAKALAKIACDSKYGCGLMES